MTMNALKWIEIKGSIPFRNYVIKYLSDVPSQFVIIYRRFIVLMLLFMGLLGS